MSSTIFSNPFNQERAKIDLPKKKSVNNAQPSPDEIRRSDLEKHLRSLLEGKPADPKIEKLFADYLKNGNSFGYLDDSTIRDLFSKYVSRQIAEANPETLFRLIGPESVFNDYLGKRHLRSDSLESQLYDYVLLALEEKKKGKDLVANPVSLTAQGLDGFINHLVHKDKGLTFRDSKLDNLRTSSDPMMRLLRDVSVNLGLQSAIDKTKDQLRSGESSSLTSKLGDNIQELLRQEDEKLNQVLLPGGELVLSRTSKDTEKLDAIELTPDILKKLGRDAAEVFGSDTTLNFGEFFRRAHKLSLGGENSKEELAQHVSRGLSVILAYFKVKVREAEKANDSAEIQKAHDKIKAFSNVIQGNGLLPERLARIIRNAANTAILSDEFRERASLGDLQSLSDSLREEFINGLEKSNKEIAGFTGLQNIIRTQDKEKQIVIIDPTTFVQHNHEISWVESSEIKNAKQAEENKYLTVDNKGKGSPISVERVVQAYESTVEKGCDKIYLELAGKISGKENVVSKKIIERLAHSTEEDIAKDMASSQDLVNTLTDNLIAYKSDKALNSDAAGIENAVKKYVEETLNITDAREKSSLWKVSTNKDGSRSSSPIASAVSDLVTEILTSTNSDDKRTNKKVNPSLQKSVQALVKELVQYQSGSSADVKEKTLLARLKDSKAKERFRSLMSSLRIKFDDSEDFGKTLDLDKVVQVFEGTDGKKLQRALEDLSLPGSKFGDIKEKQDSEQFGEFATLLFAKDSKGGVDESKRLTALAQLVRKAAGNDQDLLASLSTHVVSKLKGSSVKSSDETALAVRLKKALASKIDQVVIDSDGKKTTTQMEVSDWVRDYVTTSQQRYIVLKSTFQNMQRQLDTLKGHFSAVGLRYFGDAQDYATRLKPAVDEIIRNADTVDKNSPDALKLFQESIKSNDLANTVFNRLNNGFNVHLLKSVKTPNQHPGDILDRVVNLLQQIVFNPVLGHWKSNSDAGSSQISLAKTQDSPRPVETPSPQVANNDSSKALSV